MGWGIDFKADIYLSKQSYDSKWEVEDAIEEAVEDIAKSKGYLMALAIGRPKDIIENDEGDIMHGMMSRVEDFVSLIKESSEKITLLNLYLEYLTLKEDE